MPEFIKGFTLSHDFFEQEARPILARHFPDLRYSAGLLGYGSDVLGYDDPVSADHMWGPRFYLFLEDMGQRDALYDCLCDQLPHSFKGYSVNFSPPDPQDGGVRHAQPITAGKVSPLIFIQTFSQFLTEYLGTDRLETLSCADWLAFSEHKLLALTSGRFFHDGLALAPLLEKLRYYPDPVWYYQLYSNWLLVAEEQAFVGRCAMVGDALGAQIICARMAERLMRLAFLYRRKYAPYSKWFGTAFAGLDMPRLKSLLESALGATDAKTGALSLVRAQKYLADLHDSLELTAPLKLEIEPYFGRDIQVIRPEKIARALAEKSPLCQRLLPVGSLCQVANFTALTENAAYHQMLKDFYAAADLR